MGEITENDIYHLIKEERDKINENEEYIKRLETSIKQAELEILQCESAISAYEAVDGLRKKSEVDGDQ